MKLTNKTGLPDAIVRAVEADPYNKGEADFSITELLKPSRLWALEKQLGESLEEDVSDRLWSLYGQIAHSILERANMADLAEKRFFMTVCGRKISGQIDTLSLVSGRLTDYKFTTSYGFIQGKQPKPEWTQQLNMQAFLLLKNGHAARSLHIVGLLRDWQHSKARLDKKYPQSQIATLDIEKWSEDQTERFFIERIRSHETALKILPKCSTDETWGYRRCQDYCSVSHACTQYQHREKNKEKWI